MRRFFSDSVTNDNGLVTLTGDEARHVAVVLRMRPGDELLLIDGKGTEYLSRIESVSDNEAVLNVVESRSSSAEPAVNVSLFQCLPKQGKMELIIQKCVELGIHEIVPTVSRRCVVKIDGKDGKLVRWNKVAQEASKQCGRAFIPEVKPPVKLSSVDLTHFDAVLLAYENEDVTTLKASLNRSKDARSIAVFIGPEGGFESSEAEELIKKGAVSVSLGKRILRTETAGIAALAQIMYEFEQ